MTRMFSAEIEAISSQEGKPVCGLINAVVAQPVPIFRGRRCPTP
jgi:hypothetical protein